MTEFSATPYLLNPQAFEHMRDMPVFGAAYKDLDVTMREHQYMAANATVGLHGPAPEISMILRVKGRPSVVEETAQTIDILKQHYPGAIELVVGDTESAESNRIREITRAYGGTFLNVGPQELFTYPDSLNKPIKAAGGKYVFPVSGPGIVGSHALSAVFRWDKQLSELGMISGSALPTAQATNGDMLTHFLRHSADRARRPAERVYTREPGLGVAHLSVVAKAAWEELGGYPAEFADGGEDGAFTKMMLAAGMVVMRDNAIAVHYGKGSDIRSALRQARHNYRLRNGHASSSFDQQKLGYRADLKP